MTSPRETQGLPLAELDRLTTVMDCSRRQQMILARAERGAGTTGSTLRAEGPYSSDKEPHIKEQGLTWEQFP